MGGYGLSISTIMAFDAYYWHFDMLADRKRNSAYNLGIRKALEKYPNARCVDVGSGSGLLALLCLKHGANETLAIEVVSDLAQVAVKNAAANGYAETMHVKNCHSTELGPMAAGDRYQVMVGELLDTGLIGEGVLHSLRHAIRNLLSPSFITVPRSARVVVQLVEGDCILSMRGITTSSLRSPSRCENCPGAASPVHLHAQPLIDQGLLRVLSKPRPVFDFDFSNPPGPAGRAQELYVRSLHQGRVQGVLMWWDCDMGEDVPMMSTRPGWTAPPDHWRQALFVLSPSHGGGTVVEEGEFVVLSCAHNDDDMWFRVRRHDEGAPLATQDGIALLPGSEDAVRAPLTAPPLCECYMHTLFRPHRWWWLNSTGLKGVQMAARSAKTAAMDSGGVVVALGEGPLLPAYIGKGGSPTVVNGDEDVCHWLDWLEINEAPRCASELPEEASIAAIVGEPYYSCLGECGSSIAAALQFCAEAASLRERCSTDSIISPSRCVVRAVLVECESLWLVHQAVGVIEGVDMSAINTFLHPGNDVAREVWMWEHKHAVLSDVVTLFELQPGMSNPEEHASLEAQTEMYPNRAGTIHMVVTWIEFQYHGNADDAADGDLSRKVPFSAPGSSVQEAAMLNSGVLCHQGETVVVNATLASDGKLRAKVQKLESSDVPSKKQKCHLK